MIPPGGGGGLAVPVDFGGGGGLEAVLVVGGLAGSEVLGGGAATLADTVGALEAAADAVSVGAALAVSVAVALAVTAAVAVAVCFAVAVAAAVAVAVVVVAPVACDVFVSFVLASPSWSELPPKIITPATMAPTTATPPITIASTPPLFWTGSSIGSSTRDGLAPWGSTGADERRSAARGSGGGVERVAAATWEASMRMVPPPLTPLLFGTPLFSAAATSPPEGGASAAPASRSEALTGMAVVVSCSRSAVAARTASAALSPRPSLVAPARLAASFDASAAGAPRSTMAMPSAIAAANAPFEGELSAGAASAAAAGCPLARSPTPTVGTPSITVSRGKREIDAPAVIAGSTPPSASFASLEVREGRDGSACLSTTTDGPAGFDAAGRGGLEASALGSGAAAAGSGCGSRSAALRPSSQAGRIIDAMRSASSKSTVLCPSPLAAAGADDPSRGGLPASCVVMLPLASRPRAGRGIVAGTRRVSRYHPFDVRPIEMLQRCFARAAAVLVTAAALSASGCGAKEAPKPSEVAAPATDAERALALLDPSATLPARVEVVALADAVAVAAAKAPSAEEQARLYRLAADLRLRVWRIDRSEADAREALELYATTARTARGKEAGCEADRARAALAGELPQDASVTYRYLYLAKRRHADLAGNPDGSACLASIDRQLAMSVAYRPSGEELATLEREGDRAEQLGRAPVAASAEPEPSAAPSASIAPGTAVGARDVIVAPAALAPAKGPVKITKIEKYPGEGGGRVVVFLSEPTSFKVGALDADGGRDARIFVDIDQAGAKGIAREIEVGGAIKRVRTGPRADATRIVLDLAAKMHRRVFYLPAPFRIVIDVSARPPEPAPSASGPRTVKRVAIDAGHGGEDSGAVGPTGLKEKDVTLDIAQRIAPILADELKIETLLTRDRDVFVPLDERTARANAFHADLFVSIHCNASETGDARGIEVFILDEIKDTSRAAARIAALENGVPLSGALDASALDAEMASIATRLGSGQIAESSRLLGLLLGKATLASLGQRYPETPDHGLKSAGFYVLAGAEMPAVLFETSFISNPEDEARLAKVDYRQRLADGVVNAIRAYREGRK